VQFTGIGYGDEGKNQTLCSLFSQAKSEYESAFEKEIILGDSKYINNNQSDILCVNTSPGGPRQQTP